MSVTTVTTRISYRYLMGKSKSDLADMVLMYARRESDRTKQKYVEMENVTDELIEKMSERLRQTCYTIINEIEAAKLCEIDTDA